MSNRSRSDEGYAEPVNAERFARLEIDGESEETVQERLQTLELQGLQRGELQEQVLQLRTSQKRTEAELAQYQVRVQALNQQIEEYQARLGTIDQTQQEAVVKAYLRGLSHLWPAKNPQDSIDEKIIRLVTHPDFVDIYWHTLILKKPLQKHEYLLMRGLQLEILNVHVGYEFFQRLAPLGLNIVCPYLKITSTPQNAFDKCMIEGGDEGIDALCQGRHDVCVIFQERTGKFATGELSYVPAPKVYAPPEIVLPPGERETLEGRLLNEIEEFWRGD
ncbi:MAG: hypothetical protein AABX13_03735 [Nanoarchaeota archaeon]